MRPLGAGRRDLELPLCGAGSPAAGKVWGSSWKQSGAQAGFTDYRGNKCAEKEHIPVIVVTNRSEMTRDLPR